MRICVIAALYHPYTGGLVESVHGLAKELVKAGDSVLVLTCNTEHVEEESILDGVRIVRVPSWNPRWLNQSCPVPTPKGVVRVFLVLRASYADVVATQTRFFPLSWIGFVLAKYFRKPTVHTERGAGHPIVSSRFVRALAVFFDRTLGSLLASGSDATVGVSQASCDFLRQLGARSPIRIPNGVDVGFWSALPRAEQNRNERVITFVGRLVIGKGVQDLFDACAELSNIRIVIVGSGPYEGQLRSHADRLGISRHVKFMGRATREEIRSFFAQTTIFVNPSWSEGLPRSVLEAAAAGLPIIATDVGGTGEIITNDVSGLLVQPHEPKSLETALGRLLSDASSRERFGRIAQQSVARSYNWELVGDAYQKLFHTL